MIRSPGGEKKVVQERGIDVDKDELIKALQYDRGQYEKGYINGYNAKASEIFEEIETSLVIESFHGSGVYYAIRADDYLNYKKKYTEDGE